MCLCVFRGVEYGEQKKTIHVLGMLTVGLPVVQAALPQLSAAPTGETTDQHGKVDGKTVGPVRYNAGMTT